MNEGRAGRAFLQRAHLATGLHAVRKVAISTRKQKVSMRLGGSWIHLWEEMFGGHLHFSITVRVVGAQVLPLAPLTAGRQGHCPAQDTGVPKVKTRKSLLGAAWAPPAPRPGWLPSAELREKSDLGNGTLTRGLPLPSSPQPSYLL